MRVSKIAQILFSFILISCSVIIGNSQTKDSLDNWLKIKLFETTRQDIEKIFGQGSAGIGDKHSLFYATDYGGINIIYSTGDCVTGSVKEWNVPEWTVTRVFYQTDDDPPKLKRLLKDLGNYKSRMAGDVISMIDYYNEERGISFTYDKRAKEVIEITVEPTLEQEKKYNCKLLNK